MLFSWKKHLLQPWKPVLWRFLCGSGSSFYVNADPDPVSGTKLRIPADSDPGQTLTSQKVEFFHEKYVLKVGKRSKNIPTRLRRYKSLMERQETRFTCKILITFHAPGSESAFPIRIRIRDSQINVDFMQSGTTTLMWKQHRLLSSNITKFSSPSRMRK